MAGRGDAWWEQLELLADGGDTVRSTLPRANERSGDMPMFVRFSLEAAIEALTAGGGLETDLPI
ncbi:MAG: hypothetical protein QM844_21080 [Planctomycetota bacterium]|nr:hypothetical protein [Planctomycetota bacterium]